MTPRNVSSTSDLFRLEHVPVILALLLPLTSCERARGAGVVEWDRKLSSLQLKSVHLAGASLAETWSELGQRFLVRTVLFSRGDDAWSSHAFSFSAESCSVSDVLNAVTESYAQVIWTQDPRSGVVWIHPREVPYNRLLDLRVELASDEFGVPIQDGVLPSLAAASNGLLRIWSYGPTWRNTFDSGVDLTAGVYSARDIVNACCLADPTVTLRIEERTVSQSPTGALARDETLIQAVHLVNLNYRRDPPSPGALLIWRLGVGQIDDGGPPLHLIRQKLADPDPSVRSAAKLYLQSQMYRYDLEGRTISTSDPQVEAWDVLAGAEIICRTEGCTYPEAVDRLRRLASDRALFDWPPELALLTGLELARLGNDSHPLQILSEREFKPGELAGVRSRIHAIARLSPVVREKMRGALGKRLIVADPSFSRLADVRPNPPKSLGPQGVVPAVIDFKPTKVSVNSTSRE